MSDATVMRFDGPCPFLFCDQTGAHAHPICPTCRAVRYGNINCSTCSELRAEYTARGDLAVLA